MADLHLMLCVSFASQQGESLRTGPLHVKQIVPAGAHLLCPPNRLPPLESSSLVSIALHVVSVKSFMTIIRIVCLLECISPRL